jgi:hypothetical protein
MLHCAEQAGVNWMNNNRRCLRKHKYLPFH